MLPLTLEDDAERVCIKKNMVHIGDVWVSAVAWRLRNEEVEYVWCGADQSILMQSKLSSHVVIIFATNYMIPTVVAFYLSQVFP
jgi:hypothetical protein